MDVGGLKGWTGHLCGEAAVFSTEVEVHQVKAAWGPGRVWSTSDSLSVLTMGMEKKIIVSCSAEKESTCTAGDLGSTPGLGRSPGEGKGNPL